MAAEEVLVASTEAANNTLIELGKLGRWLQAIGILVVLWIIIQIVNWISEKRKMKRLKLIEEKLERVEKKIDKLRVK